MGLSPNFKSSKMFAVITERHFYVLFCNGDSPISGKLPIEMGRQLVQCQTLEFLITLIYIKIFVDYVGDICGWCRLLALIQAVFFFKRRLDPTNKAEFFKTCFGFYWCPDCSWCIGSTRRPQHRRTMCLLFWWSLMGLFTTQKRKQWGLPLIRAAWRFFSLKNHLQPAKEIPKTWFIGEWRLQISRKTSWRRALLQRCGTTLFQPTGDTGFLWSPWKKTPVLIHTVYVNLQAMTRKPRLVIDWACGRLLFRSLEEPDSLESVFGSLHGWGKLRFWMVLNFADLRWFEGGTAFDHQM